VGINGQFLPKREIIYVIPLRFMLRVQCLHAFLLNMKRTGRILVGESNTDCEELQQVLVIG